MHIAFDGTFKQVSLNNNNYFPSQQIPLKQTPLAKQNNIDYMLNRLKVKLQQKCKNKNSQINQPNTFTRNKSLKCIHKSLQCKKPSLNKRSFSKQSTNKQPIVDVMRTGFKKQSDILKNQFRPKLKLKLQKTVNKADLGNNSQRQYFLKYNQLHTLDVNELSSIHQRSYNQERFQLAIQKESISKYKQFAQTNVKCNNQHRKALQQNTTNCLPYKILNQNQQKYQCFNKQKYQKLNQEKISEKKEDEKIRTFLVKSSNCISHNKSVLQKYFLDQNNPPKPSQLKNVMNNIRQSTKRLKLFK